MSRYESLLQELDERCGWRRVKAALLDRKIPEISGRVSWLYTFGSATLFLFLVQVFTGILLAMNYAPTPDHAYASIQFIDQTPMGGLLRAVHKWAASLMVIMVTLHLLRVFFMGAYKYPREMTWATGVFLFVIVLGFGFTGYLLPWDQKAYWATQVGTEMAEQVPLIGPATASVLKGGEVLGARTLTRFYSFHVLLLPALLLIFVVVHLFLVVWHGISAPPERKP